MIWTLVRECGATDGVGGGVGEGEVKGGVQVYEAVQKLMK
jgi:hypothetical protein